MSGLSNIELDTLRPEELPLAAGVAARGMRDNPSSIALFEDDPVRRVRGLEPIYQWVLGSLQGPVLVARRNGIIVGLAALAPPEQCFFRQTAAQQKIVGVGDMRAAVTVPRVPWRLVLPLLRLGPGALSRLSAWGEMGMRHDPQVRHQHVELVVVEAALQGLGIGGVLMDALCREMDAVGDVAYLETDKQENLRFYERFGFEVTGEAAVHDTTNWYMQRRARPQPV